MIKEYNLSGICNMAQKLITLRDALSKNKSIYYFNILDMDTLGYIDISNNLERMEFIPVSFKGQYFKEETLIKPIKEEATKYCSCGREATRIYSDIQTGAQGNYCDDCADIEYIREEGYAETGEYYSDEECIEILKCNGWKSSY